MNENMLRNIIELSSRPGGYTMDDLFANFPQTPDTFDDLAELAEAGLITPRYDRDILRYYEPIAQNTF